MPPAIQAFWNKLNANEKLVMYGAGIVVIAFLIGAVGGGFGTGSLDLIAAIAIAVIYWLKYSPNQITWPAPVQTIVLIIAGISAVFALLAVLGWIGFFGLGLYGIGIIVNAIGCGVMAYGAWKEYQAMPKTAAVPPSTPPSSTPPAPPAPPAA
jgi:hypothetical protein